MTTEQTSSADEEQMCLKSLTHLLAQMLKSDFGHKIFINRLASITHSITLWDYNMKVEWKKAIAMFCQNAWTGVTTEAIQSLWRSSLSLKKKKNAKVHTQQFDIYLTEIIIII